MKGAYVDGFLLVVPKKNAAAYKKIAQLGKKVWMKHGALDYKECRGDDLKTKSTGNMQPRSFTSAASPKANEEVWFSFIVFKSKAHRDAVNKKVMADPTMNDPKSANMPMPFDPTRMCYGGFTVEVGA